LAAKNLNRNSIGYEINSDFIPIIKGKIGGNDAFMQVETEIIKQPKISINFEEKIQKLPYLFVDTHKLDKQIDVKKLQYGSKLDAESSGQREQYFIVKGIINPELIKLNNDLIIRLIGIKQNPVTHSEAVKFLTEKLKGKRIFLRHDSVKYDNENHLLAYVYLENKTFVNVHLLKTKLTEVDTSLDFRYKNKFLEI
jgi:site-specific DNA-methyltransferase (adenine-specific)